jgi:putative toxin-antitoxin system antitoxin component (TIGR02293 family)
MAVVERVALSDAGRVARFMGLPKWSRMSDLDLVGQIERGLPTRAIDVILKRVDPAGRWMKPTDVIPKATYYRLKDKTLSTEQSERVLWLAKVLSETMRQYHDETELALLFLVKRHPMLGMRSPYDLAKDSVAGADLVLELLGRLEAGVAV